MRSRCRDAAAAADVSLNPMPKPDQKQRRQNNTTDEEVKREEVEAFGIFSEVEDFVK